MISSAIIDAHFNGEVSGMKIILLQISVTRRIMIASNINGNLFSQLCWKQHIQKKCLNVVFGKVRFKAIYKIKYKVSKHYYAFNNQKNLHTLKGELWTP